MLPAPSPRQHSEEAWESAALDASRHVASHAGGALAHPSNLAQLAAPRTVRQKLEFGAGSRSDSRGAGPDAASAADAAEIQRLTYAARRSAPGPGTSVTPGVGLANGADGLSLRQPPGGVASESPTQTKLRSLLKVGASAAMPSQFYLAACRHGLHHITNWARLRVRSTAL